MAMPTLQQIIGTITGKVAFERTQANFTTIKDAHDVLDDVVIAHKAENATLTVKGHVQLQTTVDDSETKALTPKSLNTHIVDNAKHLLQNGGTLGGVVNFNTLTVNRIYQFTYADVGSTGNPPEDYGVLFTYEPLNTSYNVQMYYSVSASRCYIRTSSDRITWHAWAQL